MKCRMSNLRRVQFGEKWAAVLAVVLGLGAGGTVHAQMLPQTGVKQQSYADYYMNSMYHYQRPQASARNYIIDKYYYQNPNISPYLNLARRSGPNAVNNYYRYVLPEVQRRSVGPRQPGIGASSSPISSYPTTGPIHTAVPTARSPHLP